MSTDPVTGQPQENQRAVIIIPARRESSRLKEKLLQTETGRPLISYTIEQAQRTRQISDGFIAEVIVASDDEELLQIAEAMNATPILTKTTHPHGTSRVIEAVQQLLYSSAVPIDVVINLQADQPEISPDILNRMSRCLADHRHDSILTVVMPTENTVPQQLNSANNVKVLVDKNNKAIDFSRDAETLQKITSLESRLMLHVGVYGFRLETLLRLHEIPISFRSVSEGLEQLTALDNGFEIRTLAVPYTPELSGIDTEEDYLNFVKRRSNGEILH